MKRKIIDSEDILKQVQDNLGDFYSPKQIELVGREVLNVIITSYRQGGVVDIGLGRTYLKLRKNNTNFSPAKSHSIVFRGDVNGDISRPMIDEALEDQEVFDMLYSRRGTKD